jgi:hypothetical protein
VLFRGDVVVVHVSYRVPIHSLSND